MRRTLGTAVFAGMLGVTLFGIFMTPVFFYVVRRFTGGDRKVELIPEVLPVIEPPHHAGAQKRIEGA